MGQDQRTGWIQKVAAIAGVLVLAACTVGVPLSEPPNLYLNGKNYPSDLVPRALQVVDPPVFYVTDRAPQRQNGVTQGYSADRSNGMAFGAAKVQFGAVNWEDLVARTHVDRGGRISRLEVQSVQEIVRFDDQPLPVQRQQGALRIQPSAAQSYAAQTAAFQEAVRQEIKRTGNGRLLIYTHGISNDFQESVQTLASLWHFTGRQSVPISFSWPAGNGGLLEYFQDREAGEFSVYHAKEFLRMLAAIPEVDDIDIVAHSRGTSVMTQALREAVIFARGQERAPKIALKTGTLILAAPDLDLGVMRQRLMTERVGEAFEQINIYVNPDDFALRLSSYLTKHPRIGSAGADDFAPGELAALRKQALVHFIRVEGANGSGSHSYFRQNPAVLSDIVLALRTRAFPGGTLRPLEADPDSIWRLQPNYPLERLPDLQLEIDR